MARQTTLPGPTPTKPADQPAHFVILRNRYIISMQSKVRLIKLIGLYSVEQFTPSNASWVSVHQYVGLSEQHARVAFNLLVDELEAHGTSTNTNWRGDNETIAINNPG